MNRKATIVDMSAPFTLGNRSRRRAAIRRLMDARSGVPVDEKPDVIHGERIDLLDEIPDPPLPREIADVLES